MCDYTIGLIVKARWAVGRKAPYLSSALWPLTPRELPANILHAPMAVSENWVLYYCPELMKEWDLETVEGVLTHEVWHLLRDHSKRMKAIGANKYHEIANIATDCEINDDIIEGGCKLPDWVITPQRLEEIYGNKGRSPVKFAPDLLAEEYYNLLMEKAQKITIKISKCGPGNGKCGSGATGHKEDYEGMEAEIVTLNEKPVTETEKDLIRREVARQIQDYGRQAGNCPAGMLRWADAELAPAVVDWRRVLAATIRRAVAYTMGATDYYYSRPNRHRSGRYIYPSLRTPVVTPGIVVDTSGSMDTADLNAALAETDGILRSCGYYHATMVSCDAAASNIQKCTSVRQFKLIGGGGTDMGVGMAALLKQRPKPGIMIVITDGETPWPEKSLGIPTICCLVRECTTAPPKWMQTINAYSVPSKTRK